VKRSGFEKFLQKSQVAIEELWGDKIEIDGILYACAVGTRRQGGTMGTGGDIPEGFLTVRIRKSLLPVKPEDGKTVLVYDGAIWRVDEVKDQGTDGVWSLSCIPASE